MDCATQEEPALHEVLQETLLSDLGALAGRVPFDLAVIAELEDDRLVVRAVGGHLARHGQAPRTARLVDCPLEQAVVDMRRLGVFRPAGEPLDPLSGVVLPRERAQVTAPLFVAAGCTGTLTLVRAGGGTFHDTEVGVVAAYARIFGLTLHASALSAEVERLRSHGDERVSLLETELRGPAKTSRRWRPSPDR